LTAFPKFDDFVEKIDIFGKCGHYKQIERSLVEAGTAKTQLTYHTNDVPPLLPRDPPPFPLLLAVFPNFDGFVEKSEIFGICGHCKQTKHSLVDTGTAKP